MKTLFSFSLSLMQMIPACGACSGQTQLPPRAEHEQFMCLMYFNTFEMLAGISETQLFAYKQLKLKFP